MTSDVICEETLARVLRLTHKPSGDVAVFTVSVDEARREYRLAIDGSYGSFAACWSAPGASFTTFLCRMDSDYLANKMVSTRPVFSGELTAAKIRKDVLAARRRQEIDADAARVEFDLVESMETEGDFALWQQRTEFFTEEPWFFWQSDMPREHYQFMAMHKRFWSHFVEALHAQEAA